MLNAGKKREREIEYLLTPSLTGLLIGFEIILGARSCVFQNITTLHYD